MTLLARRREELERERAPEESGKSRSVAVRPPRLRPSFLHLQAAIGNRALSGLLARELGSDHGLQGQEESWLRQMLLVPGVSAVPLLLSPPRRFLVPDGTVPAPGQMTRDGFLAAMRNAAREAAERGLAGTGRTAQGCPWIEHYFRFYERQSAGRIEADLLRYVPAAREAASAEELLALASGHVLASVRTWAATGELTGVPRGLPGAGLVNTLAGPLAAVQAELGEGRPLESATRSRMEQAFGARFDEVRVHTGEEASRLARELDARAFALGPHVAFGHGEYRPGTVVGDAVLAHELAHTLQQRGATSEAGAAAPVRRMEGEADAAAAGVLARLWGGAGALAGRFAGQPTPRLRSGLALARCQENFSDQELRTYLQHVTSGPEGGLLGDNKARAVVRENLAHPGKFPLSDAQVRNMIEEMLQGSTGEDDQKAILELLKDSKAARLQFLFTKGGLTSKRLLGKLSDYQKELKEFFEQRFEGGLNALQAGDVRPIPDADREKIPFEPTKGESRGFRLEDLKELRERRAALTFTGSLSPLTTETQKFLLDNIAATVSFVLDPESPDRIRKVEELRQEWEKEDQKRKPDDKKKHPFFGTPAERIDARDLYHGHVCVPQTLFNSSSRFQKLRDAAGAYNDFGPGRVIGDDIRDVVGSEPPHTTRPQARQVMAAVEKHRARFRKTLALVLEELKKEPDAGVSYHTWEKEKPKLLQGDDPIRNIFTPFSTNQPEFQRVGHQDCASLINFSFHVNRSGQVTLLPGASSEMVRAFEILNGWGQASEGSKEGEP